MTHVSELTILKPTDMFYSKLLPALKERGITNIMSRREWPVDVLKRVFLQLFKETPRSILAQELWCSSTSPAEWWKKTCIYNRYVHRPALQLKPQYFECCLLFARSRRSVAVS